MHVAIVGAGVSGLVAANLLRHEHEITVFEANDYPGGHTNTVRVDTHDATLDVDTGFIVFNERNYPNFESLLNRLGVASQPSEMSFGVSDAGGGFEYAATNPNGLYATRSNIVRPSFHRMIAEVVRFQRDARALLRSDADPALGHWLEERRFSRPFVERLIVPQAAAVWSADPAQMWTFPARFLIEFFDNHGMLTLRGRPRWRTVEGGSHRYVQALTREWRDRIRLSTPIVDIARDPYGVTITPASSEPERYDAVVIGAHADQALAMLPDASPTEREILGSFPYQPNEAVLHTDAAMLPRRRRAWASWNYHLAEEPATPGRPTVTYLMNRLQNLQTSVKLCVTLNRTDAIDPEAILDTFSYSHPVYTTESAAAQERHREISGVNRTHFCGAYWGWGFHEDGVVSAIRVANELGVGP